MKGMKKGRGSGTAMAMRMKQIAIVALILVAFVSIASLALAATLTIEPDDATVGEVITINGTGFGGGATVTLRTTAICYKPVVDGKCECTLEDFVIPKDEDVTFWLSVREVEDNVTIYVKKLLIWWTIDPDNILGFQFTYNPDTNTSNVTRAGVPAGTYNIDVIGDAVDGAVNCSMTTTVEKVLTADGDGNFSETFDTTGIPICNLTINATSAAGSDEAELGLFLLGDASKDGRLNAYDCCCIARYVVGIPGYDGTTLCLAAADVDGTPGVTINDAKYLAEYLIGLHGL